MKKVRNVIFVYGLILTFVLAACGSPTPLVIVVTATSLPPTDAPIVEPTPTLVPVALAGPQSGTRMTWIDGSTLVYVPPSEFTMGNEGFDAPVRAVTLDGFWMQQTKVTNRMFTQCVAVGSCVTPTQELGGLVYSNPEFANHPVVGVTWDQAQSYCSWCREVYPPKRNGKRGHAVLKVICIHGATKTLPANYLITRTVTAALQKWIPIRIAPAHTVSMTWRVMFLNG